MVHRTLQFLVVVYVCVFAIWYKSGYQGYSDIDGVVFTKVKGVARSNETGSPTYDASDLVIPAAENKAVFIATRTLTTKQYRDVCPDDSEPGKNNCTNHLDCIPNTTTANGYLTGDCDNATKYCVIIGWCPTENPDLSHVVYSGIEDWTLFMRSEVAYTKFNTTASNGDRAEIGYNIFSVRTMLNKTNLTEALLVGAIIRISLDWTCNLNLGGCLPVYSFRRVDNEGNVTSIGYNYRDVIYFNSTIDLPYGRVPPPPTYFHSRIVTKYYGLRFLIEITGQGAKFDIFELVITVGSGVAFFGGASLATDFMIQSCHPRRKTYDKATRAKLHFEEAEKPLLEEAGFGTTLNSPSLVTGKDEKIMK